MKFTTALNVESLDTISDELDRNGKSEIVIFDEDGRKHEVTILNADEYPQFLEN